MRAASTALVLKDLGHVVERMTEEELCRVHRRITRSSGRKALPLAEVVSKSVSRSRAKVTHPGKR